MFILRISVFIHYIFNVINSAHYSILTHCIYIITFSYERKPPVMTRAILDFNFSAAPVNSDPCIIQLMFENTGVVSSEW